jgi:uncharacterized protein (TIGR02266 family)
MISQAVRDFAVASPEIDEDELSQRTRQLEEEESKVEEAAKALTQLIQNYAKNLPELLKHKPQLELKAREIGHRRWLLLCERQKLEKKKESVDGKSTLRVVTNAVPLEVEVTIDSDHNFYTDMSGDLGQGGLFVATLENLPKGTQVDLTVIVPGQPPFRVRGVVSWVRESNEFNEDFFPGLGVAFVDLSGEARQAFEEFAETRTPILYETI